MNKFRWRLGIACLLGILACCAGMAGCQLGWAGAERARVGQTGSAAAAPQNAHAQNDHTQNDQGLLILDDSELPETYPRAVYNLLLRARGGTPPLHWRVEKGMLPPGIRLEDNGLLIGEPLRTGEFQFTVSVTDSGKPQQAFEKGFVIRVRSALTLNWKSAAHVNGNRIDGSVEVTNTTNDDMDLTFVAMAVAENGRATAIGYQRFVLRHGTVAKELPFGETLPHGGYVVHVDAVGEVEARNLIYRQQLQTPGPLQVVVGP